MALHWDLSKLESQQLCWRTAAVDDPMRGEVAGEQYLTTLTHTIIWYTLSLGINRLASNTVEEFWLRMQLYERLHGPPMVDGKGQPRTVSWDELVAHLGLRTNVTQLTRTKWIKILTDRYLREQASTLHHIQQGR